MHCSVLIPSYNRIQCLGDAIDSVLAQTHFKTENWRAGQDYQIIVIDDGSNDGTAAFIRDSYPQVELIEQGNSGVSAARNAGLAVAKGEWVGLLDSDDTWLPSKLAAQFEQLARNKLLVSHTQEIWVRNGVRVNQHIKHKKYGGFIYQHCLPLCAMSPSSILIHRKVFDAIGEFDEALPACEDYDLWLRLCARFEVDFVAAPQIIKTGGHADQLSRQYWGMDRYRVIALEKILLMAKQNPPPTWKLSASDIEHTRAVMLSKLEILRNGARKHQNQELEQAMQEKLLNWSGFEL